MILQAMVYIAVDMLPVPGSQGITELMYQSGNRIVQKMLISRESLQYQFTA